MRRSCAVRPSRESTRNTMASASAIAVSVCFAISAKMPSFTPGSMPPVSTTRYGFAPMRPVPYRRSRVSPGTSATGASRLRVSRLNRVDLPTFGRPTRTSVGFMDGGRPGGVLFFLDRIRVELAAARLGEETLAEAHQLRAHRGAVGLDAGDERAGIA